MKNLYYLIWADAIKSKKKQSPNDKDWQFSLFLLITMLNALNFWVIQVWLKYFGIFNYSFNIDIFPGRMLNGFTVFLIQFASPFIIINYFLIFYKEKYKKLLVKYPDYKGKIVIIYGVFSALLAFASALLYNFLRK
jgi:hypothetical protein